MKLIPILFSTPMVQAIITGDKTNTRRLNGLHEINEDSDIYEYKGKLKEAPDVHSFARMWHGVWVETKHIKSPYGQPGDVLWVRETWCKIATASMESDNRIHYSASTGKNNFTWKPSIHMPFEACRIFLRVKEIRVERLRDIKYYDALSEGIISHLSTDDYASPHEPFIYHSDPFDAFKSLWISINGADSWNANPWVWVIAFERITDENEIAAIRKQWNDKKSLKTK